MRPSPKPEPEQKPGAFMPDGSYFADAEMSQRGTTDRFVRAMVKSRRLPFSPAMSADAITLARQTLAFPNHAQWSTVAAQVHSESAVWPAVWTSTAAEEAVKRCGNGSGDPETDPRHWCGEPWAIGAEKACENPGHRQEHDHERVARIVAELISELSDRVADRREDVRAQVPDAPRVKPANEDWFQRRAQATSSTKEAVP